VVVCIKVGRSEAAARAALSHTGAIVGSNRSFSAVLRRYGAIEVEDFHELVETLEVLGRGGRPGGMRIAAISESGGECALLADQAESAGIPFEPLPEHLAERLQREFPNYLAPGNPLDAWAVADERLVYPRSLELMAESGAFDILVAQADLSQFRDPGNDEWCELTLRALAELRDRTGVFVAGTTVHSADPPHAFQELARELRLPLLRGPRDAMLALARVARVEPLAAVEEGEPAPDVSDLLEQGALTEHRSALALERLGVPFAPRTLAADPEEAAAAADALGYPVVVKRDGPAHKAREGGVVLGLTSADEVAAAATRLGGRVLIAKQAEPGDEVLCGMTRDPDFGPVLAVGVGGAAVESANRVAVSVAPLDLKLAVALVEEAAVTDPAGVVAQTLVALSRLALAHPEIESIDVNPLIVMPQRTVAVDALLVVGG
jgi:acetyltransferase